MEAAIYIYHDFWEHSGSCVQRHVNIYFDYLGHIWSKKTSPKQWRSQSCGDGVKLALEGPPGRVGPLP